MAREITCTIPDGEDAASCRAGVGGICWTKSDATVFTEIEAGALKGAKTSI